jgi:transposase
MPKLKKSTKDLKFQTAHLDTEPIWKNLTILDLPKEEIISMVSKDLKKKEIDNVSLISEDSKPYKRLRKSIKKKKRDISIIEFQALINEMILKDNLTFISKNTKSLEELDTNGENPTKVWLDQCKDLHTKIWLPSETGCVGLSGNSSIDYFSNTELISSSKIIRNIIPTESLPNTYLPLSTYSPHDTKVYGGNILLEELKKSKLTILKKKESMLHNKLVEKNPDRIKKEIKREDIGDFIIAAKCIKVTPTAESIRLINDSIAACRKIWNLCCEEVQTNPGVTEYELRKKFIEKKNMPEKQLNDLEWTFRTPQAIRESVTRKFYANYKTAQKNLATSQYKNYFRKNKETDEINQIKKEVVMQFREASDEKQVIYLANTTCKFEINNDITSLEVLNGIKLQLQEAYDNFDTSTKCEQCQHVFRNLAGYELHMNRETKCEKNPKISSGRPQMEIILQRVGYEYYIYVPEYKEQKIRPEAYREITAIDLGEKTMATYFSPDGEWGEICPDIRKKLLYLHSEIERIKNIKKKESTKRRAITKRLRYIKNMVNDLQWKMCHWLLSRFKKIIVSRLYVARTSSESKMIQRDLRLCGFVDRLIQKSIEYPNSEIHIGKEHYTTQACTKCLSINTTKKHNGGIVSCLDCKHESHRDFTGSRNFFQKHTYKNFIKSC